MPEVQANALREALGRLRSGHFRIAAVGLAEVVHDDRLVSILHRLAECQHLVASSRAKGNSRESDILRRADLLDSKADSTDKLIGIYLASAKCFGCANTTSKCHV